MAYQGEGTYENVRTLAGGRAVTDRPDRVEYAPSERENRLGIGQMMNSDYDGRPWSGSLGIANPGRNPENQNTSPIGYINPGYGPLGQSARAMYGEDPQGLMEEQRRRDLIDEQWRQSLAYQSPQAMQAIQSAAVGGGPPSAAQAQLAESMGQAMRDQMALAGSSKGDAGQRFGAQLAAQQNVGQMQSTLGNQMAALRAQEMMGARQQYLQQMGLGQRRELGYFGAGQDAYQQELARRMRLGETSAQLTMGKAQMDQAADQASKSRLWNIVGSTVGGAAGGGSSALVKWVLGSKEGS